MPPRTPSRLPGLQNTKGLTAKFATFLIYGGARVGKTSLALSAEDPLILATELGDTKGLQSLRDNSIPYIPIENADEFNIVVTELSRNREAATYEGQTFKTIITDSYTALGALWMAAGTEIMFGDADVMLWDKAKGKDPRNVYAYLAEKGRKETTNLFEVRAHIVMLCREGLVTEGEGKDQFNYAVPELPGLKLSRELPGWPDFTFRMRFVNRQRVFVTSTEDRAVAGPRLPSSLHLPQYIKPNIALCTRVMLGDLDALRALSLSPEAASPQVRRT